MRGEIKHIFESFNGIELLVVDIIDSSWGGMEASLNWGEIIFGPSTKAEIDAIPIGIGLKILEKILSVKLIVFSLSSFLGNLMLSRALTSRNWIIVRRLSTPPLNSLVGIISWWAVVFLFERLDKSLFVNIPRNHINSFS